MTITDRWIRIDGELFWHDSGRQMCHRTVVATRGLREPRLRLLRILFFRGVLYKLLRMFLCSQQLFTRTLSDRCDLLSGTPQFGGIACISLSCDLFDVSFFVWISYLLFFGSL